MSSLSVVIKKSEVLKDEGSLSTSQTTKTTSPIVTLHPLILLILGFMGFGGGGVYFETGFHSVARLAYTWGILLQPLKHWDYRHAHTTVPSFVCG